MNYQLIIMGSTYWMDESITKRVVREFLQRYSHSDNGLTIHTTQAQGRGKFGGILSRLAKNYGYELKIHVVCEHYDGPNALRDKHEYLLQIADGCLLLWAEYSPYEDSGTVEVADMYSLASQTRIDLDLCKARREYKFFRAGEGWKPMQIG